MKGNLWRQRTHLRITSDLRSLGHCCHFLAIASFLKESLLSNSLRCHFCKSLCGGSGGDQDLNRWPQNSLCFVFHGAYEADHQEGAFRDLNRVKACFQDL